jgi:outer membrane protein assembly factor BamB
MTNARNKTTAIATTTIIILIMTLGTLLPIIPFASAQIIEDEIQDVGILLQFSRAVTGVGQVWPYGLGFDPGSQWYNYYGKAPLDYALPTIYTLFTGPNGTVYRTNGPYQVDPQGVNLRANYTFNQVGVWNVKVVWPGDVRFRAANVSTNIVVQTTAIPKRPSTAFLSFRPFPYVGLGQSLLVNAWISPAPELAPLNFVGYMFTFTKPDGATMKVGPMDSELPGTVWFEWPVDQIGNWTLKFEFPGDYFTEPASVTRTFIVQQDPILSLPDTPFPTGPWQFPINIFNRAWRDIAGPWPQQSYDTAGSAFNPYTEAPKTAHIRWKLDPPQSSVDAGFGYGGFRGSPTPITITEGVYSSHEPVISTVLSGIGYFQEGGARAGYTYAVNMTNGEIIWTKKMGFTIGAVSRVNRPVLYEFANGHMRIFEGYAGVQFNDLPIPNDITFQFMDQNYISKTVAPGLPGVAAQTGGPTQIQAVYSLQNFVSYQGQGGRTQQQLLLRIRTTTSSLNGILDWERQGLPLSDTQIRLKQEYNATLIYLNGILAAGGTLEPRLIKWSTSGATFNFAARVIWNISMPADIFSPYGHTLIYKDILFTRSFYPQTIIVYNLMAWNTTTGALLYNKTLGNPSDPTTWLYRQGPAIGVGADSNGRGVIYFATVPTRTTDYTDELGITYTDLEGRGYTGIDLETGNVVWTSEATDYPWGDFWAYNPQANAYGMNFGLSYDGVYAFNLTNGKIVWHYKNPTGLYGYETPYNSWPFGSTGPIVGGGVVFAPNTEHSPTFYYRGQRLHALDAFTGQEIWNIMGVYQPSAIAYGTLLANDNPNGVTYAFAKGETATTVVPSAKVIANGGSILLEGTVLDMSPAQAGTAAVSDASQTQWMEYLHMQQPLPMNASGVEVTLDSVDPNGNFVNIGKVTTDTTGAYSFLWTPPIEGKYTILASFTGSEAYYSSFNEASIGVTAAPATPAPPATPQAAPDNIVPIVGSAVAVIAALVIATALLLRKRP